MLLLTTFFFHGIFDATEVISKPEEKREKEHPPEKLEEFLPPNNVHVAFCTPLPTGKDRPKYLDECDEEDFFRAFIAK